MLCERQSENTQQLLTYSVAYPDAAITLIDTFSEHIAIKYSERESPFLGYLKTIHRAIEHNATAQFRQPSAAYESVVPWAS